MSIWTRIGEALTALREGEPLSRVFARLRAPPERSVAFTIAVLALGAKLAKVDGTVKRSEVAAFREVFTIAPRDEAAAARVYNLARRDAAGYRYYARQIAALFAGHPALLEQVLEGLFHVALADGGYHAAEDAMLGEIATIFGLGPLDFQRLRGRLVPGAEPDPYSVLGVAPQAPLAEVRAAWRAELKRSHPDVLTGQGLPPEAIRLAERRLFAVNRAWERIRAARESGS